MKRIQAGTMPLAALTVAMSLFLSSGVSAQQQGSKKQDPSVARQAEAIRKLQASEAQLKEANAKLTQEKTAADEALAAAQKERAAEAARIKAGQSQLQGLRQQLGSRDEAVVRLERELEQARRESRDQRERLDGLEKERQSLIARTTKSQADFEQQGGLLARVSAENKDQGARLRECRGQNTALSAITHDLLTAIDRAGHGEALLGSDPFSGYKRVRVESLIQEYRDKVDDRRVELSPR
jgi:chromosome segregation ATPase